MTRVDLPEADAEGWLHVDMSQITEMHRALHVNTLCGLFDLQLDTIGVACQCRLKSLS